LRKLLLFGSVAIAIALLGFLNESVAEIDQNNYNTLKSVIESKVN